MTFTSSNGLFARLQLSGRDLGIICFALSLIGYSLLHRGLISYREFTQAGFEVRLFERDDLPGGNWHYSEEVPPDAPVPNADPAVGDFIPSLPPKGTNLPYTEEYVDEDVTVLLDRRRNHREPKPVWASLKSNAPSVSSTQFFVRKATVCSRDRRYINR